MNNTLLIPLVGPLQSWSVDARFGERLTAQEPSKSGVIGLVCAALGRDRAEPIDDIAALRFGVRIDRPGILIRDYHTALDVASAGTREVGTVLSNRWYLSDAAFLAGLEGDPVLLTRIFEALADPVWPVFLGRKSCPPAVPLARGDGPLAVSLEEALATAPPLPGADIAQDVRLVLEDPGGPQIRPDQPLGSFAERRFVPRRVRTEVIPWNSPVST